MQRDDLRIVGEEHAAQPVEDGARELVGVGLFDVMLDGAR